MKEAEYKKLVDGIYDTIGEKGIPIDVRHGDDGKMATYIVKLIRQHIDIDEPLGVSQGIDYDHCPRCGSIVGQSAFYCKHCGCWLREGGIR